MTPVTKNGNLCHKASMASWIETVKVIVRNLSVFFSFLTVQLQVPKGQGDISGSEDIVIEVPDSTTVDKLKDALFEALGDIAKGESPSDYLLFLEVGFQEIFFEKNFSHLQIDALRPGTNRLNQFSSVQKKVDKYGEIEIAIKSISSTGSKRSTSQFANAQKALFQQFEQNVTSLRPAVKPKPQAVKSTPSDSATEAAVTTSVETGSSEIATDKPVSPVASATVTETAEEMESNEAVETEKIVDASEVTFAPVEEAEEVEVSEEIDSPSKDGEHEDAVGELSTLAASKDPSVPDKLERKLSRLLEVPMSLFGGEDILMNNAMRRRTSSVADNPVNLRIGTAGGGRGCDSGYLM